MTASLALVVTVAFGFDRAVAAFLMGATEGQTVSQVFGLAARQRIWWGTWGSRALDILVEPNHCELALSSDAGPTGTAARMRSAVLLVALFVLLTGLTHLGWVALLKLFGLG